MTDTINQTETPKALADATLDGVSGGPHFRTWDSIRHDHHAGDDALATTTGKARLNRGRDTT